MGESRLSNKINAAIGDWRGNEKSVEKKGEKWGEVRGETEFFLTKSLELFVTKGKGKKGVL